MKSWIRGSLLITICLTVILVSVYALYRELTVRIDKKGSHSIGSIIFKKKSAERKYAEFVIWEDIANNSPVYNYDSVRTFKGSAAYIRLESGAEISLDEDTMIVLITDEKGVNINFDHGTVSAKSGGVAQNISLNTKDVSISMKKGELAVKKGDKAVDVNVSSGEALIDTGGAGVKTIDNNVKAQIINGKTEVKKNVIIPEFPANNTFFVSYKNRDNIEFKWRSDSSENEIVQISKDSGFKDIEYTLKTRGKSIRGEIAPGDYYWRIVSGSETSSSRKFVIIKDSVPEQFYPGVGENVSVSGDDEPVSFKWSASGHATAYELEIATDSRMGKPLKKLKLNLNSAFVHGLPAGNLWWRINRIYPEGFIIPDNRKTTNGFNLTRTVFTRVKPKILNNVDMYASTLTPDIIFNWEGGKGIKDYTVDISSDKEFKKIIKSSPVSTTFYNTGQLTEGKYYWRVKANYGKDESLVSETVFLTVSPPKPVVYLSPPNGSIISENTESVKFTWKDISEIGAYLFETSGDPDFKKIITTVRTDLKSYSLRNPPRGKLYWRVSIVDKTGKYIVKGESANLIIPETLQKPVLLTPANMSVVNLDNTDVIKFQWEKTTGADSYQLEIFQRVSGADKSLAVFNTETTSITISNFRIFNPGTIVWIVKAKKSDKGKITAVSESDRKYFVLKVNEFISAPKLKVPDTIYVR